MPHPLIPHINSLLRANSEADYLAKIKKLVPSEATIIGVRVPVIKELAKTFGRTESLTYEASVDLLDALFARQIREEILFGLFLLETHKRRFSGALFAHIERWVDYIENWEVGDQLATRIAGEIVAKDLTLLTHLLDWTESDNLWRRRAALATTVALNQKGRTNVEAALQVAERLMTDTEPLVVKAAGWTLRAAGQHDEQRLFEFLLEWKARANPKIIKQGAEKLSLDLRQALFD